MWVSGCTGKAILQIKLHTVGPALRPVLFVLLVLVLCIFDHAIFRL